MDDRVARLKSTRECEVFAKNARRLGRSDLALEAERRAIELLAQGHQSDTAAEREAIQAIYAYEHILTEKNGRRTRANRTWQMVKRYGIIEAINRVVSRPDDAQGYLLLKEKGMEDLSFEAIVLRYPESFSEEAVSHSAARLARYNES